MRVFVDRAELLRRSDAAAVADVIRAAHDETIFSQKGREFIVPADILAERGHDLHHAAGSVRFGGPDQRIYAADAVIG